MNQRRPGESRSKRRARACWTATERAHVLGAYRASGKTQEEFARQAGIKVGTLRTWIYRRSAVTEDRGQLAPVRIVEGARSPPPRGAVTLRWPQGIELEIALDLDGPGALGLVRELLAPCLR